MKCFVLIEFFHLGHLLLITFRMLICYYIWEIIFPLPCSPVSVSSIEFTNILCYTYYQTVADTYHQKLEVDFGKVSVNISLFYLFSALSSCYTSFASSWVLTVFFGSCRICHCEGDDESPLITPCHCTGSLRFVHQACLQQWIKSSDTRCCELCKYEFIMETKLKPLRKVRLDLHVHLC